MIEELLGSGQYQKALELLENPAEETGRYYRLICLYGLGEYERGYEEAKAALYLAGDTYYDVLCYQLTFMKELEKYEEAVDFIIQALEDPALPYAYEAKLNEVYDELLDLKRESYAAYEAKNRLLNEKELLMYLNKGGDERLMYAAIDQLFSENVRRYLGPIRQLLRDKNRSSLEKALLLEILVDQQVDEELTITKHDHTVQTNPVYLETVADSLAYQEVTRFLTNVLESHNPGYYEMAEQLLAVYLYDWYPLLEVLEEPENIACALHSYIAMLNWEDVDIEDLCCQYGADRDAVEKITRQLAGLTV